MADVAVGEFVSSSMEVAAVRRSRRRRWAMVLLVSLSGIVLSLLLGWLLSDREQTLAEMQFKLDAGERIESLQRTATDRLGVLDMVAAFFYGSQSVDRNEFHAFTKSLIARHRGMELLAWVPRVTASQRQDYEQAVRGEGVANYQICQRDSQGRFVAAENRDEYCPIQFVETPGDDQSLLGFDLLSSAACRLAIKQATATRRQAAAVGWPLGEGESDDNVLYVVTPTWKASGEPTKSQGEIDGFVLGVFRINTIVEASLSLFPPAEIDIYLTGLLDIYGKTPFHSRLSSQREKEDTGKRPNRSLPVPEGGIHEIGRIDVADSRCTVDCVPTEGYLMQQRTWGPLSATLAGLVISGLLVGYLHLLTGRTEHVERRAAERAAELQSVSSAVLDAVLFMDAHGHVAHWNPAAERIFGYSYDEVAGRSVHDILIPSRYREAAERGMQVFASSGRGPVVGKVVELESLRKDGTEFPIEISISPILLEDGWGAVAIIRDITQRKQSEDALRREKQLLREMLDLHERDRKLVAYEIHDGLAQQLTAALYRFQSVDLVRNHDPVEGREMFDEGMRILRQSMVETRRLISGLRPPVLDELGVVAALECLIGEKQQNGCPEIEFCYDIGRLAAPLESSVFRIVQECLTNACRYSQSKKVRVELCQLEGRVRIEVQDWGIGFDPTEVENGHYGLRGIHERARLLGGEVTVNTAPQQGTHITVDLPLIIQSDERTA